MTQLDSWHGVKILNVVWHAPCVYYRFSLPFPCVPILSGPSHAFHCLGLPIYLFPFLSGPFLYIFSPFLLSQTHSWVEHWLSDLWTPLCPSSLDLCSSTSWTSTYHTLNLYTGHWLKTPDNSGHRWKASVTPCDFWSPTQRLASIWLVFD